jgi:Flp pilus assembly protein TadG
MNRISACIHDEEGGALIETAVVLPAFLLLLFGFFSFAIVLQGYTAATFASWAGARYASVNSSTSLSPCTSIKVNALAASYLYAVSTSNETILTTWLPAANTIGGTVNVSVKVKYALQIPFFGQTSISVGNSAVRVIVR